MLKLKRAASGLLRPMGSLLMPEQLARAMVPAHLEAERTERQQLHKQEERNKKIAAASAGAALQRQRLGSAVLAAAAEAEAEAEAAWKPELVIFDKDGTLIDFKFMWGKWAAKLCDSLERAEGVDAPTIERLTAALGYDRATNAVSNRSPICCTPMHMINGICLEALSADLGEAAAERTLADAWHMPCPINDIVELTDLKALFTTITRDMGAKVAVCTTDNRAETMATLRALEVDHLVAEVLCGDDKHVPPKPSADQIHYLCDRLGASVAGTVMVGDTITDMKMAKAAGVAFSVGIPFGAGSTSDLLEHADFLLPNMDNFARLISPQYHQPAVSN